MINDENYRRLHPKARFVHALAVLKFQKNINNSFDVPQFQQYKQKCLAIVKKTDKWHAKLTKTRNGNVLK